VIIYNTTTGYIEKIDITYPVAGIDNSSQGFRDNFKNIKLAFQSSQQDMLDLKGGIFNLDKITIGGTNTFTTGTNISDYFANIVTANSAVGQIALLPNQITVNVTGVAILDVLGNSVASAFPVDTTLGILSGATFTFASVPTVFSVASITTNTVVTSSEFPVTAPTANQSITFTNPQFIDQPVVTTLSSYMPSSVLSAKGDLKGRIHANATALYVDYNDYSSGINNKFMVSADTVARHLPSGTSADTAVLTDSSTLLATTDFVQKVALATSKTVTATALPKGIIMLWSGSSASIPGGWALCNGVNGTPNLIDTFVIAAGGFYAAGAQGGTANSVVVLHNHVATTSVNDPGHQHATGWGESMFNGSTGPYGNTGSTNNIGSGSTDTDNYNYLTSNVPAGVTVTTTLDAVGVSGENMNLPPYYALCYIMRVI
jgi:hypothetical protein